MFNIVDIIISFFKYNFIIKPVLQTVKKES